MIPLPRSHVERPIFFLILLHPLRLSFGPTLIFQIYTRVACHLDGSVGKMEKAILARQLELLRHIFPDVLYDIEQRQPEIAIQILDLLRPNLCAYMSTYFPDRKDMLSLLEMRSYRQDNFMASSSLDNVFVGDVPECSYEPSITIMVLGTYEFLSLTLNAKDSLRRFLTDFKTIVIKYLPIGIPEIDGEIVSQSDLLGITLRVRSIIHARGAQYAAMYYRDLARLCLHCTEGNSMGKSSSAPVTPVRPLFSESSKYDVAGGIATSPRTDEILMSPDTEGVLMSPSTDEILMSPATHVSDNLDWELEVLSLAD